MILLGIDPSLNALGWSVIVKAKEERLKFKLLECGLISATSGGSHLAKLSNMSKILSEVCDKYCVSDMAIEETIVNNNPASSLKLGMVRGACIAVASIKGINVTEYKPNTIKSSITGHGHATKDQVAFFVKNMLLGGGAFKFESDDISDSIGVGITHMLLNK